MLNHRGHVSEPTRLRVLEAIGELGYVPDLRARSLKSHRAFVLGLFFTYSEESMASSRYFRDITASICAEASRYDYKVMVSLLLRQSSLAEQVNAIRQDGLIGGLIVAGPSRDQVSTIAANSKGLPTLILSAASAIPEVSFIDVDNRGGMLQAVEHLVRLGHRRIAYVTPLETDSHSFERLEGYRAAMEAQGLSGETRICVLLPQGSEDSCLTSLMEARPTAIVAFDDLRALLVHNFLKRRGLRVPQDVALVGFDDEDFAAQMEPALTTIAQPFAEMGSLAAEKLIERIQDPTLPPVRVSSPLRLVIRDSCGAALSENVVGS